MTFECPLFGRDGAKRKSTQPHAPIAASALQVKKDVHNALHFNDLLRVQVVGHLDVFVVRPGDLEGKACACELNKPQAEIAGVGVVIVGLDVADTAVIVLKLTLNDKIGVIGPRQIKVVVAGGLVIEQDLKVLVARLSGRHVIGVEFQLAWPWFNAHYSILAPIARRSARSQRLRVYREIGRNEPAPPG